MKQVSVAEAKAHLSELIREVESGEEIVITRHGETVAMLSSPRKGKPLKSKAAFRERFPDIGHEISAVVGTIREDDRH